MASNPKVPCLSNENAGDGTSDPNQDSIEKIDEVQNQIDVLNEQASEEILKVEQKFNKFRQPLFEKRSELIAKIPNFWYNTFVNHPQLTDFVTDKDEAVLKKLIKLEVQEFEDIKSGYKINLHFDKNEWFKNEVITKEFHLGDGGEPSSKSTTIDWYPEMDLTSKPDKKANNGGKPLKRGPDETGHDSFFCWFIEEQAVREDDIGEVIKDDVWPNPLQYYLSADGEDDEESVEDEDCEDEADELDDEEADDGEGADEVPTNSP